jgi:hypothetical protein
MKRREFLKTSAVATGLAALPSVFQARAAEAGAAAAREYYELRLYHLRTGVKQKIVEDYLRQAFVPAMGRIGAGPIGVFQVMTGPDSPTLYVLVPHPSVESFATASQRLGQDPEYQKAGAEFINAPATDPAFVRMESSLMAAFEGMPRLEVPELAKAKKPRFFELRTYESHSKKANKKKIEMFNVGEIAIFRRAGLTPVFFGETLIGAKLPNLTYLLVYEDMAAKDKSWGAFGADPEWKKLRSTPGFTDAEIVSNISNVFLRPTAYSQI